MGRALSTQASVAFLCLCGEAWGAEKVHLDISHGKALCALLCLLKGRTCQEQAARPAIPSCKLG